MELEWLKLAVPVGGVIVMLLIGLPISFSLALGGFVGYAMISGFKAAGAALGIMAYEGIGVFVFSAIPLFILMGELLHTSGIGSNLYDAATKWFGGLRGGLSIASIVACAAFAAMCGLSIAGAVTIGIVAIPEMIRRGYNKRMSVGSVAVGATLGILIPPSLPMIVYGIAAEQSIGRLFIAGIIPGIMLAGLFSTYVFLTALRHPEMAPGVAGVTWREKFASLRQVWMGVVIVVLVLGGIYAGVATPTEAAGVGAFSTLCLALYRRTSLRALAQSAWRATEITGFVLILVVGAMFFSSYLTITGVTQAVSTWLVSLEVSPFIVLGGMCIILIFLGTFLDSTAIILLTTPLFLPAITALGFDPIWYGVILVLNIEIAFITPPVGLNLYAIRRIAPEIPLGDVLMGSVPFLLLVLLGIAMVVAIPQLALWLPSTMLG